MGKKRLASVLGSLFLVIFLFFLSKPDSTGYAANPDISLSLETNKEYGPSQILTGKLILSFTELSSATPVKAFINKVKVQEKTLAQLLDEAAMSYQKTSELYTLKGSGSASITTDKIVALRVSRPIASIKLLATGQANNLVIDVGNDNSIDWQYYNPNAFTFSPAYYPPSTSAAISVPNERAIVNPQFERCENIFVDFDELFDQGKLQITVYATTLVQGSNLKARLFNLGTCDLPEPSESILEPVSCIIDLDAPLSDYYQACAFADTGQAGINYYHIPITTVNSTPYYFITLRKALFATSLSGQQEISGERLKDAINNYIASCNFQDNYCIVPLKFSSEAITLSNLELIDNAGIVVSTFYEVDYQPSIIQLGKSVEIPLEGMEIQAPTKLNSQNELEIEISGKTAQALFNVVEAPVAKFAPSLREAALLESIIFDASTSKAPSGRTIVRYNWDFGDNALATTTSPIAAHSFSTIGQQEITLTIEDSNGLKSSPVTTLVTILPAKESVEELLQRTKTIVEGTLASFNAAQSSSKEIVAILKLKTELEGVATELESYDLRLANIQSATLSESQQEAEFKLILDDLIKLHDKVPVIVKANIIKFDNFIDYKDIPDPSNFKSGIGNPDPYKVAIYSFQEKINIDARAYAVSIRYLSGRKEEFRLVTKSITSSEQPTALIEVIPYQIRELLTQGEKISPILVKYSGTTNSITYTLSPGALIDVQNTKTIALPDLSQVDERIPVANCGDAICTISSRYNIDESNPENQYYCEQDCVKKTRWGLLIFLILIGALGIYYINFYKGPWNFRDTTNYLTVLLFKRRLFTSHQDLVNLSKFVKESLAKGFTKRQLTITLLKKGWTEQQLRTVFDMVKK